MAKPILLFVFAAVTFCSTAILIAQEQAPAPSFKEGDTWQFNIVRKEQIWSSTDKLEGMYELSVTKRGVKLYELNSGQRQEIPGERSGGLFRLIGRSKQQQDLKFPLSAGQTWTYQRENRMLARPAKTVKRSAEITVAGMEEVTTPAGSFRAYKLTKSEDWLWVGNKNAQVNHSTTTYFYCPEIRSIVKSSTVFEHVPETEEIELIKFTPGN